MALSLVARGPRICALGADDVSRRRQYIVPPCTTAFDLGPYEKVDLVTHLERFLSGVEFYVDMEVLCRPKLLVTSGFGTDVRPFGV